MQTADEKQQVLRRVFVVEDDELFRAVLLRRLRDAGYEAHGFERGADVIAAVQDCSEVVLLLDHQLPDMSGDAVVSALAVRGIKVPFIVVTGQGNERLAADMIKLGAIDYLVKDRDVHHILPEVVAKAFRTLEVERLLREAEAEREVFRKRLMQSQKMESIGRLAGGIAHDFNNLLSVIYGYAELGLDEIAGNAAAEECFREVRRAAERAAELTRQLVAYARKQVVTPRWVSLHEEVQKALVMPGRLLGDHICLELVQGESTGQVHLDPDQLNQIVTALCLFCRDLAGGRNERVLVRTGVRKLDKTLDSPFESVPPGNYAELLVSATGPGMSKEDVERIFEPFFGADPSEGEVGLGLASVYGMVRQNGGYIVASSDPAAAVRFCVYLPMQDRGAPGQSPTVEPADVAATPGYSPAILLVEDEASILRMIHTGLERAGYRVWPAASPAKALAMLAAGLGPVDLLITDVIMPEMNGGALAGKVQEYFPGVRCLFVSGYTEDMVAQEGVLDAGISFLEKPFTISQLLEKIRLMFPVADPDRV